MTITLTSRCPAQTCLEIDCEFGPGANFDLFTQHLIGTAASSTAETITSSMAALYTEFEKPLEHWAFWQNNPVICLRRTILDELQSCATTSDPEQMSIVLGRRLVVLGEAEFHLETSPGSPIRDETFAWIVARSQEVVNGFCKALGYTPPTITLPPEEAPYSRDNVGHHPPSAASASPDALPGTSRTSRWARKYLFCGSEED